MSNRAHARRRLAAWDRYHNRWPNLRISMGSRNGAHWWVRANRHRPARRGGA